MLCKTYHKKKYKLFITVITIRITRNIKIVLVIV